MANTVARIYSGFRGVDFRGEEVSLQRSPDSLNMWKDYRKTESIRTRPGMRLHTGFSEPVYGVFFFNGAMLVHSGNKLYNISDGRMQEIFDGAAENVSDAFVYEEIWYFKDGVNYLRYDGQTVRQVEGYVPTTSIGRKPAGGGTTYEDVNMLTGRRINTFLPDGISSDFYLDSQNIDRDFAPVVIVNGETVSTYTVDYDKGMIRFSVVPAPPDTDGQDNVSVEFSKTIPKYRESILGCKLLQVFDNRVFFSGNDAFPNVVWHCSLNDPGYVSDLDYYREGMDSAKVTGMVAGNNALWVFREPSQENTSVFYHTPTLDADYGKIYPSSHSSISIGCTGKAVNFNDDIVFFSDRGMEGISGDITTEQVAAHRSSMVDSKLLAEAGYRDMVLAEWEGYLLVFVGTKAYLADSRATFSHENHMEYEWFYWDMGQTVTCAKVQEGKLYLGTDDGVYIVDGWEDPVQSYWVTPKDRFNYPNMLKTTNKRGCVAEATGEIHVYAKTEKTDFELISKNMQVTDYFVSRIKRKKFKDIQLKFYTPSRFSLETVTMECFIGGYIKR